MTIEQKKPSICLRNQLTALGYLWYSGTICLKIYGNRVVLTISFSGHRVFQLTALPELGLLVLPGPLLLFSSFCLPL